MVSQKTFNNSNEIIEYIMETEWLKEFLYNLIDQEFYGQQDEVIMELHLDNHQEGQICNTDTCQTCWPVDE
jgi:hypothetical protein